jgi:hypothetical protein
VTDHPLFFISLFETVVEKQLTIRSKIINKIQVIRPEIYTAERCVKWHGKTGGSTPCQGCVEIWCYCQRAGEGIIKTSNGDCCPEYVNCVVRLVIWVGGLA